MPSAKVVNGVQEIDVTVGAEFEPAMIAVRKDLPVRLRFKRDDQPSCGDEVVFPSLGLRKKLPPNQLTVMDLPPQSATLQFACGMDMMKGKLVVQ